MTLRGAWRRLDEIGHVSRLHALVMSGCIVVVGVWALAIGLALGSLWRWAIG